MKLYYAPGACSLSSHIVLREAGLPFTLDRLDFATRRTESGEAFADINPKGYVPALKLDNGEVLTECAVIAQYVADANPASGLAPANGTVERLRLQELLNFLSSEVHKGFSPFFNRELPDASKEILRKRLLTRLAGLDAHLADGRTWLTGETFSGADAYLFTLLNWAKPTGVDLSPWPNLVAFMGRVAARPAVQEALKAEGLV